MEMKLSEKKLRERKVLAVAPLIVIPLMAIVFHAAGGGKGTSDKTAKASGHGLNMSLPAARFDPKKKPLGKLGLYGLAEQDSVKRLLLRKQDPYAWHGDTAGQKPWMTESFSTDTSWRRAFAGSHPAFLLGHGRTGNDAQADELLGKLDQLKVVLRTQEQQPQASIPATTEPARSFYTRPESTPVGHRAPDPELEQLNTIIDKVLRIQQPQGNGTDTLPGAPPVIERPVGTLTAISDGRRSVDTGEVIGAANIPDPGRGRDHVDDGLGSGFMDIDGTASVDSLSESTVLAVVARDQTLVSGESVELRLDQDAVVLGRNIPRGTSVSGKVTLQGERAMVTIASVRVGTEVVPLNLEVFDLDGIAGIRVKGSIDRDAAKEAGSEALSGVGMTTLSTSAAGQATAAGIQAMRSLAGRKIRLVRFSLHAGYVVLLKNTKR